MVCVCVCVCVCACVLAVYYKAQAQIISNREFKLWTFLQGTESRMATFHAETCVMSHQCVCVRACVSVRARLCVCACVRTRSVCVCVYYVRRKRNIEMYTLILGQEIKNLSLFPCPLACHKISI